MADSSRCGTALAGTALVAVIIYPQPPSSGRGYHLVVAYFMTPILLKCCAVLHSLVVLLFIFCSTASILPFSAPHLNSPFLPSAQPEPSLHMTLAA